MTDYPLMGVVRVTLSVFLNFVPIMFVCGVDEAWHFKFRVLIDTQWY